MINPKRLLIKNIIMLIVFVVFAILCFVFHKTEPQYVGAFTGGIGVIIISLIRIGKMLKSPEYKKQVDIDYKDERIMMINSKTSEITGYVIFLLCCVCGLISLFMGKMDYLYIFGGIIILYSVIFYIIRMWLGKKY